MAVRRWGVRPDEYGEVTQDALAAAMVEAAVVLSKCGGVITVLVHRQPTEIPGEMVTVGALLEWKDRTDAKAQPEQPSAPAETDEPLESDEPAAVAVDPTPNPDGFAVEDMPDEDVSAIPVGLR